MFDELEKAIGLRLRHHVGWNPLVLIHGKKTVPKYEEIRGTKFRELFPSDESECAVARTCTSWSMESWPTRAKR